MTPEQWERVADPGAMFEAVRARTTKRKLRLLAAAIARSLDRFVEASLVDRTILVAELMADGTASDSRVQEARAAVITECVRLGEDLPGREAVVELAALLLDPAETAVVSPGDLPLPDEGPVGVGFFEPQADEAPRTVGYQVVRSAVRAATDGTSGEPADAERTRAAEIATLCGRYREILGNPFRPVTVPPSWRTDTVVSLARQMYESRDFTPMPILADALQDAGCEDADILGHCRGPGPHVRGCWVVDLVLGKA